MKGLVKKYKQKKPKINEDLKDQLILDYSPLIKFVAQRISARLPSNIDVDDLISAGVLGLIDAIEKHDPARDNKFKTYAEFRIRGAILDELRAQDWVPRSVRDKAKVIDRACGSLEQDLGREPTAKETANKLELPLDVYYTMISKVKAVSLLSIEDLNTSSSNDNGTNTKDLDKLTSKNPYLLLKNKKVKSLLMKNINILPDKHKLVLSLYYFEELNLKEIGKILEVTESRVSQLHTQAIDKLKETLKEELSD